MSSHPTSYKWSRIDTRKLIETLETRPELWDIRDPIYKDRTRKHTAIVKMAETFEVPCSEISRKLHNLRTQMNNELRKLKKRQSVDETCTTSNWEYFGPLKFLIGAINSNSDTLGSWVFPDAKEEVLNDAASPSTSENSTLDEPAISFIGSEASPSGIPAPIGTRGIKRVKPNPVIKSEDSTKPTSSQEGKDEFDAVGRNISCKLRRFPKKTRIFAEKLLNDVIFYAELGKLNENSLIVTNDRELPESS